MKILVTGAAGFLGSHLCDDLLEAGHVVCGVDNFFRGKKENLPTHKNFTFFEVDLREDHIIDKLMKEKQFDVVVHYAAINGTRYFYDIPYKVCNDNILLTQNVLKACTSSVQKVVYASSSEVYGPSPVVPTTEAEPIILHATADRDSYASSKAMGEFLVRLWAKENGREFLIVRPFNTYGTRMATGGYGQVIPEFIERVEAGGQFYLYGDGTQTRSFCYVKDHSQIVSELIEKVANEIVNVGHDEETSILELAQMVHKIANKTLSVEFKPAWGNDTKWRKPDLQKLKSLVSGRKFTSLNEGVGKLILNEDIR